MAWIFMAIVFVSILKGAASQDCTGFPVVANASVLPDEAVYAENDTIVYTCLEYFVMTGDAMLNCSNGTWVGALPSCDLLNCSDVTPPNLTDGYITGALPYMGGDTITYHCNENFVISGNTVLTCDNSTGSTWTGTSPLCTPVCPEPNEVANAHLISDPPYYEGTYARYICQSNHVMSGGPDLTCGTDYQWQGNTPVCTVVEQEEVTSSEETLIYDTSIADAQSTGKVAAIIFGLLLGLLLLLLLLFLLIRFCCWGAVSSSACFGRCCGNQNDLQPLNPRKQRQVHAVESQDIYPQVVQPDVSTREKKVSTVETKKRTPVPEATKRERFQMAVERVMGNNNRNKTPKKVEGVWMPHSNRIRVDHITSTK